jgi:amidase
VKAVARVSACGLLWMGLNFSAIPTATAVAQETGGTRTFNLTTATIEDINAAFDAGALTSVRLVELYLARIEAYDARGPRLNAIISLNPNALQIAAELDGERASSEPRGPMHGIPIFVKDNYDTFDMPTAAGSVVLEGSIPPGDAFTVRQLRDAGAIILGKVNMSEFASPAGWGSYSSLNGITLNSYDLRRTPAGSSGGTGVAIAATFATVGLGTDTGGSIRGPAAANGLVGIRATYGLLSREGIVPQAPSLDMPGPMARSVTDAAIALGIMADVDPSDPTTLESEGRSYDDYTQFLNEQALRGARIGVGRDFFGGNPEIDALIEAAIQAMRGLGATIIESVRFEEEFLNFIARTGTGLRSRIDAEFKPALEDYLATLDDGYPRTLADIIGIYESPQVMHSALPVNPGLIALHKRNLAIGGLDNPGYIRAIESDLPMVRRTVLEIMERDDLDALVFPTSRCPTGTLHTVEEDVGRVCERGRSATNLSSYSGFPDIQVPAGFTSGGLPTTISFLGRAFSEPELLGFAFAFEQATRDWRLSPLVPPLTGEAFDY